VAGAAKRVYAIRARRYLLGAPNRA
jgi:hypothetical protein